MGRHNTWRRMAALALASSLALTACGGGASSSSGGAGGADGLSTEEIHTTGLVGKDATGEPTQGGTLTVAEYGELRTLNPAQTYANGSVGGSGLAAIYDTLMRYDWPTATWKPQLAESLKSTDNKVWTLTLRPDVKFADGTLLDADAVVGSINYYTSQYGYQSTTLTANGVKMTVKNPRTVVFKSGESCASFPAMLAGGVGMIMAPAAYADAAKDPAAFKPIGAGAFELEHYRPAEELVLKARPDYWNGAPHLEQLKFVWLGSDDNKFESLSSGAVDSAYLRSAEVVEKARRDGFHGMMYVVGAGAQLVLNMREGRPGADERVRQAVQLGFDNDAYVSRAWNGAGMGSKSLFPSTSPWSTGIPEPDVDTKAAAQLVTEAKADGWDGTLTYLAAADPASQAAAVQVQAQLKAIGIDVQIENSENIADGARRLYVDHDFDMAVSAANVNDADPYSSLFELFSSTGTTNLVGYQSKEMDQALADLRATGNEPTSGAKAMKKIEELLIRDVPVVQIGLAGNFLAWPDKVNGIVPTVQEMVLYDKAWKQ